MTPLAFVDRQRPWMTALEMQFQAVRNAASILSAATDASNPEAAMSVPKGLILGALLAEHLDHAQTFAWSPDVASAVTLASKSIPEYVQVPSLEADAWWHFRAPLPLWPRTKGRESHATAMSCHRLNAGPVPILGRSVEDGTVALLAWKASDRGPIPSTALFCPPDTPLSAVIADAKSNEAMRDSLDALRFYVAAITWMAQRIIVLGCGQVERHFRKRLQRTHQVAVSDVKVVSLRRLESSPHYAGVADGSVDWTCRWIVNGHWRHQPYRGGKKLIYIMPYVKGPEDKPLKVPAHTVYAVNR